MKHNFINPLIEEAYKKIFIEKTELTREFCMQFSKIEGEDIMDLASLANKVKNKFAGKYNEKHHVCTIMNAKSGACSENCKFCSQSAHNNSDIEVYDLKDTDEMIKKG